jgi:hypothetical protein
MDANNRGWNPVDFSPMRQPKQVTPKGEYEDENYNNFIYCLNINYSKYPLWFATLQCVFCQMKNVEN